MVLKRPGDVEAAIAIELAGFCRELRQLPRAGGILDQDGYDMYLLQAGLAAINEQQKQENEKSSRRSKSRRH